ncbi:MAG: hypothetical protein RSA29_10515 [Clostridium sp.]|uniref:hypothetical protein n=1 Tax=Clostridium sp. TaxID=1506 RepID=UPI00321779E3
MTLEELQVVISANTKQFNNQVAQVQTKVDSMASRVNTSVDGMSGTFDKLGKMLAGVFAIATIAKFTKSCLDLGSNLTEVQNVVDVTFGSMSAKVDEFAKNAINTAGLSETMAKKYMGNFGAMSKSMGFAVGQAEEMSETLTNLSGDVASFYNIKQDEAYTKLKSVFTGETEALKELGVVMTQENLDAYALANGFGKTTEAMNQQEKVSLRLAYVTQTLSAANGDFARTSGGWANQVRLLSLQFQSLKASIGQGLIAVLTPVINVINTIMGKLVAMANTFNSVLSSLGFSISGSGSDGGGGMAFAGVGGEIEDAAGAMNNLGGATDGVGEKADKAKKKLGALVGFDEINTLKSSDDDSAGGGAGSGGVGGIGTISSPVIDTSQTEKSLIELNNKVQGILSELLSPLKTAWDNYGEWFLSKWDYFKNSFGYSCDSLKVFLLSVWDNGGKAFVQRLGEVGIAIGGVALQIGGDILVALGNFWNYLNPDNNPYTRKFIDSMNSLAISARDFIVSAGNWFGKFLDLGGQAFINVIGDIVMLVGTILAEIIRDAIKFVTDFMNSWAGSVIIGAVAVTLNIVAGAIKAVAIVIEKCHKVLEVFLVLWGAWKFKQLIEGVMLGTNTLGKFVEKIMLLSRNIIINIADFGIWAKTLLTNCIGSIKSLGSTIATNAIAQIITLSSKIRTSTNEFIAWGKNIILHPIKSMGALKDSIVKSALALKEQTVELIKSTTKWAIDTASKIGGTIATKAHTLATGGATVAQMALNLAMDACPIILLISGIVALVVAVKNIGDKFGWWTSISNALGSVLGWIGDKVGWLWDKIKGFFGWNDNAACEETIEGIGDASAAAGLQAENAAQTTDTAFGTATSNVNIYLDSIHFNATRLAEEVDLATQSSTEKFGMLSQSAQEYMNAIATHNTEKLAEMSVNQSMYNEEVKIMYADLTEAEKNEFMKQYGIIQGINDDMLNYEGLKYDERVARHSAYLSTIEKDDSISYQEKKSKIDKANADFKASIDDEVKKYEESIGAKQRSLDELLRTHGNTTNQGRVYEQELRDAIDDDRSHIENITKTSYDNQVTTVEGATDAMARANKESTDAQGQAYKDVASTSNEALKEVNKNLNETRKNIEDFINNTSNMTDKFKKSFKGVSEDITDEIDKIYKKAKNTIENIERLFNNFDATLKVKLPHFYMTGEFNAETKEVPKVGVNYFAKGGVVDRATLGVFGEAGKEAIVPLENNTEWMDKMQSIIANGFLSAMQFTSQLTSGNSSNNSKSGDIILQIDGTTLARIINPYAAKEKQRLGNNMIIKTI